ncbi:MAG: hypothetical protein U5K81_02180 [Trueperaceae bacterium]|nr:hypothetical protein [Trueperaceae bacterium]
MTHANRRFEGPIGRAQRRVLVVVALVAITIALVLTQFDGLLVNMGFWVALIVWTGVYVRVDRALHGIPKRDTDRLDERELALRNDAYHGAYRVITALGVLLLVTAVGMTLLARGNGLAVDALLRVALLMLGGYVAVVLSLPCMWLAWILPDPVDEEGA